MKFIDSDSLYEAMIDKKSMIVQIHDLVDFEYNRPTLEPLYSEFGRKAYDCIFMFKVSILQYLKNGLSDREVINQAKVNMEYRYFLDLAIDDELPHFTRIGEFRERVGEKIFQELFTRFVDTLKELNIIQKEDARYMDATHQIADVSIVSINTLIAQACKRTISAMERYDRITPSLDLDLKEFALPDEEKKMRFVELVTLARLLLSDGKAILERTQDSELNETLGTLSRILKERTKEENGVTKRENTATVGKLASFTDKDATWGSKSKDYQFLGYKHNVTATEGGFIEVISTHQGHSGDEEFFENDAKRCDGKKIVADSKYGTLHNRETSIGMHKQLVAPCRKNMKAHLSNDIMDDAFVYNHTENYAREMKKRGSLIEGMFGVMKEMHHFARAKYRGIAKVSIQGIITAFVMNLKMLVRWYHLARAT